MTYILQFIEIKNELKDDKEAKQVQITEVQRSLQYLNEQLIEIKNALCKTTELHKAYEVRSCSF